MRETAEELDRLQDLLDRSYAGAGQHLRSIHTDRARISAADLVERLQGMNVLVVATVTSDGRPLTGPVDSFLFHGRFHFGTSSDAVRTRHLERRPAVSATHVRGEELVVTVHGDVRRLDLAGADADFAELTREHYGTGWDEWDDAPPAWAVEPRRMFAADMSVHTAGD
ncbi:MAG: pyridoxamine 5'-phosphate oxidase family protein [Nitriliruptorales bacterium]